MQTFLPYADFLDTARCLDSKRLGKQRVECKQILAVLQGESTAWQHHPAVRMWAGYEDALCKYARLICTEWQRRGNNDTIADTFIGPFYPMMPDWLGLPELHSSHRGNLLLKGWKDEVLKIVKTRFGRIRIAWWCESRQLPSWHDWTMDTILTAYSLLKTVPIIANNHYVQFHWNEQPTKGYFWPNKIP